MVTVMAPTTAPAVGPPPVMGDQMPPYVPSGPPPRRGISAVVLVIVATLALVVGAALGFAAGLPGRNALQDEKSSVEAAKAQVQTDLDATRNDLTAARNQLAAAKADASASSEAKTACNKAATDAGDLIDQYENLLSDFDAFAQTPAGSAAEGQMAAHLNEQIDRMSAQYVTVQDELKTCAKAVG